MGVVYIARNKLNGICYVGKTIHSMENRKVWHEFYAKSKRFLCPYFHAALHKYGPENFEWEVVFESLNDKFLQSIEIYLIRDFGTKYPGGYNLTDGGDGGSGRIVSEKEKARLRLPKSDEHRLAISLALRGKKKSKEAIANVSAALKKLGNKGKSYEDLYGPEKAALMKEKKRKDAYLTGFNKAFLGKTHSDELKEGCRKRRIGKTMSQKSKDLIRDVRYGKTWEDIFGEEKAEQMRIKLKKKATGQKVPSRGRRKNGNNINS